MAPTVVSDLAVRGTLPVGLSGRLFGIGPSETSSGAAAEGMVHAVHLHAGRVVSYRSQWIVTDAVARRHGIDPSPGPRHSGPDIVAGSIVAFGGAILACGHGSLAYELTPGLDTVRRVDLAGRARGVVGRPRQDPLTGDLHLVAVEPIGTHAHVVVSAGAQTRSSRSIVSAPWPITDVVLTRDHVVFAAGAFVGTTPRGGERPVTWKVTGVEAPLLVCAHDAGEAVVVHALTPSLERWTVHPGSTTVDRHVVDPTPRLVGTSRDDRVDVAPRRLWTSGDTVAAHDLTTSRSVHRHVLRGRAGGFTFVADPAHDADVDRGFLVGFVHHGSVDATDLVILDAADMSLPPLATSRIPRHIPLGLHVTWIPRSQQSTNNEEPT